MSSLLAVQPLSRQPIAMDCSGTAPAVNYTSDGHGTAGVAVRYSYFPEAQALSKLLAICTIGLNVDNVCTAVWTPSLSCRRLLNLLFSFHHLNLKRKTRVSGAGTCRWWLPLSQSLFSAEG